MSQGSSGNSKDGEEDLEHVIYIGGGEDVGASVGASMGRAPSAIGDMVPHTSPPIIDEQSVFR